MTSFFRLQLLFFIFLLVLCLQHECTFSSAYISQMFSASPKHYTWRQIFKFSSNIQTAHIESLSDDVLVEVFHYISLLFYKTGWSDINWPKMTTSLIKIEFIVVGWHLILRIQIFLTLLSTKPKLLLSNWNVCHFFTCSDYILSPKKPAEKFEPSPIAWVPPFYLNLTFCYFLLSLSYSLFV